MRILEMIKRLFEYAIICILIFFLNVFVFFQKVILYTFRNNHKKEENRSAFYR